MVKQGRGTKRRFGIESVRLLTSIGMQAAQTIAAELSSIVNKAYGTLTNPYTRAEYILQREGVTRGESDNVDDPTLIMEVMEKREELDSAETQEEVDEIRQGNMGEHPVSCIV